MRVLLRPTREILEVEIEGVSVPCRRWEGSTESGTPVMAYIHCIAPMVPPQDPRHAEFEAELLELGVPREVRFIDTRLVF